MIPTRLAQQYNNGTVVGFRSVSGSVIVVLNTHVHGSQLKISDQVCIVDSKYKEYSVPLEREIRFVFDRADSYWQTKWITNKCFNCVSSGVYSVANNVPVLIISQIGFGLCVSYWEEVPKIKGRLQTIPVMRINGITCDTL